MNLLSEYYSDSNHEHWNAFIRIWIPEIEACGNTRGDLHLIIDTLRVFGEQHNEKNELANRWIHSDQIVLRRLAIHEQEISEAAPDEKLEWLLKQNLLFGRFCEHEVRQLFKAVIEHVSAAQKASLLENCSLRIALKIFRIEPKPQTKTKDNGSYACMSYLIGSAGCLQPTRIGMKYSSCNHSMKKILALFQTRTQTFRSKFIIQ